MLSRAGSSAETLEKYRNKWLEHLASSYININQRPEDAKDVRRTDGKERL
jgi:hypothetical protein